MTEPFRCIVAVENPALRGALLQRLAAIPGVRVDELAPDALPHGPLSGDVCVFLETANDAERLIRTAQAAWDCWGETGAARVMFLAYQTADTCTDAVVSRLWAIGPELTVIVQAWDAEHLDEWMRYASRFAKRLP